MLADQQRTLVRLKIRNARLRKMFVPDEFLELPVQRKQAGGIEAKLLVVADYANTRPAIKRRDNFRDVDL